MPLSRRLIIAALALICVMAAGLPALALLVQPVLINMTTTGSASNASIQVVNDRARPVTVEISVKRLTLPERGEPTQEPDEGDEFQIFPIQAVIPAGGRQTFRVRWVGDTDLPVAKMYMFSTSELPVAMAEGASGVSLYYAVESVVAVSATGARPDISIERAERWTTSEGKTGVLVTFVNDGAAVGYVTESGVRLEAPGSDWSVTFQPGELNGRVGLGIVPASAKRAMFLEIDAVPADGEITASYIRQPG